MLATPRPQRRREHLHSRRDMLRMSLLTRHTADDVLAALVRRPTFDRGHRGAAIRRRATRDGGGRPLSVWT